MGGGNPVGKRGSAWTNQMVVNFKILSLKGTGRESEGGGKGREKVKISNEIFMRGV